MFIVISETFEVKTNLTDREAGSILTRTYSVLSRKLDIQSRFIQNSLLTVFVSSEKRPE